MSDCKSVKQLCEENPNLNNHILSLADEIDELERKNKDLEDSLIELKKYYQEYDKFTARINPPGQSYKELEDKLALAENSKQTAIDDLYEAQIIPLKNQVKEKDNLLDIANHKIQCKDSRIKQLEQIIKNLNTRIDFAVGYISATQPHTDKHPMEVKRWLFEGFKENL